MKKLIHSGIDKWKNKEKHSHWMKNENEIVLINKRLKLYQMEFHDKKFLNSE